MISTDWKHLTEEIAANNAVLFVGAGLSLNALPISDQVTTSFKDWTGFMLQLASKLWEQESHDREKLMERIAGDYLYVTELFKERFGDTQFYKEFLEAVPTQDYQPSELHRQLLDLPWTEYVTTNQDDLLEKTLRQLNTPFHSVIQELDLSTSLHKRLIKMHGTWERPESLIFSEEDYRNYERKHPLIALKVKQLFAERTVFFVGFGLKDSNFKAIHSWIQNILGHHQKKAYAYMPNADEYTKTYWRKRNLVILSDEIHGNDPDERKYNYQSHLMERTRYLSDEISNIRARKNLGVDVQKNYERIKHLIFDQTLRNEIVTWLESAEETLRRHTMIAESMIKQWELAEREGLSRHFAAPLLRDIFFMQQSYRPEWYSQLPLQWFEHILGSEDNLEIRGGFLRLLKRYVETFQTTKIYTVVNDNGKEKAICLYQLLRKRSEVPASFKELLTTTYIGRMYYEHRNYRMVERLLTLTLPVVKNDLYLDELQHLRLLCLKNQFKYDELEQELKRQLYGQIKPKCLIRKGYFYLVLGRFNEAVDAYFRAVLQTENQEVVFHALFTLQQLRRMSVSDSELFQTLDSMHLDNVEEQIKSRFGETTRIADLKNMLSENERLAIRNIGECERSKDRRERKKSWGVDNYMLEAYEALEDNAEFIEHNGLPDYIIANSQAMRLVVEGLIIEGKLSIAHRYLGFGLSFKDLLLTDKELFLYKDQRNQLFQWMNVNLLKIVSMLEEGTGQTDTGHFLLVKSAEALLSQTNLLYSIINTVWIEPLVEPLMRILRLHVVSINNSLESLANRLLVRVINDLPAARSVEVFENYLRHLLDNVDLRCYSDLQHVRFVGWSSRDLQSFQYGLLVDIFRRMLYQHTFRSQQYYFLILNLHIIAPLPDSLLAELNPILRQLDEKSKNESEHEKGALLRVMIELKVLSGEEIRSRVLEALDRYEQDNRISSNLGDPLYVFAETVSFLSKEEVDRIIIKANIDNKRLIHSPQLPGLDLEGMFNESYQYFLLMLTQHYGSPDLLIREFGKEYASRISPYFLGKLRQSFEANEQYVDNINEWLGNHIIRGNEKERISFLSVAQGWIERNLTRYQSDKTLAGKIEWFIWDSSYQIKAWTISFMTFYFSCEPVTERGDISKFFEEINEVPMEENHEGFIFAMALFLKKFKEQLVVNNNLSEESEKWVEVIKRSPYRSVQLEWEK
ncbi:SIR2 family protein [Paenibacillus sp. FSL L8-0340]|uniref:SIR2 family protein n=1 Tax=Paenibacillus sp. FSL L8-0340 TaxID=2954685 RepID=UPI003158574A